MSGYQNFSQNYLAVIDPAMHTPEVGCFNLISSLSPYRCHYHLPAIADCDIFKQSAQLDSLRGIIILGSACSVLEHHHWQTAMAAWLEKQMDRKIPILAICYGHQLIAHMFGGSLGFYNQERDKLKGSRQVSVRADKRLFNHPASGTLIVSHREIVTSCPQDMKTWISSDQVIFDGFYHENLPLWTTQPHPEATASFLKNQEIDVTIDKTTFDLGHKIIKSFLRFVGE